MILQKAIDLNDNRAVYRSKLLLDQDLAARSAALGRIYIDLGFEQRALFEGWQSINADPSDYSAHRFLADTYSGRARHEIAKGGELLQAQLLQPINLTPVQPQLGESNLFILEGAGPRGSSFQEFNPLFEQNRLALQAAGVFGSNRTIADEVVQSGVWNKLSYSLGQFHFDSDGFRSNNDLKQNIYNAFVQGSLLHNLAVQVELRHSETDHGDLSFNFDLANFNPDFRRHEDTDTYRIGLHYSPSTDSHVIASVIYQDTKEERDIFPGFGFSASSEGYDAEAQYIINRSLFDAIVGGGYYNVDQTATILDLDANTHHSNPSSCINIHADRQERA